MKKKVIIFIISIIIINIGYANERDRANAKIISDAIKKNDDILLLMDNSIQLAQEPKRLKEDSLIIIKTDSITGEFKNLFDLYNDNIESYQSYYNRLIGRTIKDKRISHEDYQEGKTMYSIVQLSKNNLIFALKNQVVIDSLTSVQSKINDTYEEIDSAKDMINTSNNGIVDASKQIVNIMDKINEVRDCIVMASDSIENVSINLDLLNSELKASINKIERLDSTLTDIHKDIVQQKKQINKWGIGLGVGNLAALVLLILLL